MSESTETSHISGSPTPENAAIISIGDLQNIHATYRLNGKNYLKWSQLVRTFLKGKGKLSHLLGTGPPVTDPRFPSWDEQDSMVMSWLWNSMLPEISDTCMFLSTAKEIWDTIQQTYSKVRDAAQIYEIKTKISTTKQRTHTVTEYASLLQSLWQEIDHCQCIEMHCSQDSIALKRFVEKDRIYDFLAGLNSEFDAVRVQILGKDDLPSLNETISIIRAEEGRRSVMLETHGEDGSAFVTKAISFKESKEFKDTNQYHKQNSRDSLFCTYCKKRRHTKENCWKLHGRPNNQSGHDKGQAHVVNSQPSNVVEVQNSISEFNKEEIEKLKTFLETLEKPSSSTGICSLTFSGMSSSSSCAPNVSEKISTMWVIDSGATDHMTCSSKLFSSYTPASSHRKITIADGSITTVAGQGDIILSKSLTLKNVLHVPKLLANLVSVTKLTKDCNCSVTFFPSYCVFQEQDTKRTIGRARERDGLYYLEDQRINNKIQIPLSLSSTLLSELVISNKDKIWLYHRRLGHPSFTTLKMMFPSFFKGYRVESFNCTDCEFAKHKRTSFQHVNKKSLEPFSLIHSDIWGPSIVSNISGARWFVLFIDDCTRVTWTYLLKNKSEVTTIFSKFYNMITTQFGVRIKRFRSDNAKDYFNQTLSSFFRKEGIIHESSCVNTPQQNGVAERKNGHLLDVTRALLFHKNVPKHYWGEAVLIATHLINRLPTKVLNFKSPIDTLTTFFPTFTASNNLVPRIFGSVAFVHVHSTQRGKLDPRALRCIFIGYSSTQKGYKCFHPSTKKFFVSTDVTFFEHESFFSPPYLQGEDLHEDRNEARTKDLFLLDFPCEKLSNPLIQPIPSAPFVPSNESFAMIDNKKNQDDGQPLIVYSRRKPPISQPVQVQSPTHVTVPSRTHVTVPTLQKDTTIAKPIDLMDKLNEPDDIDLPIALRKGTRTCTKHPLCLSITYQKLSPTHKVFLSNLHTIPIPRNLSEALKDKKWEDAMRVEMTALEKNKTWELVKLPRGKKLVGCRWVFTVKYKSDGSIERYKARLVAKGYTQTYGIDYLETFAPVAKMNTVRILLSLAASFGWNLQQFDVKNAFLHGDLDEEIYMEVPPGFASKEGMVCRLKKALYGLKQSPRAWFGRFSKVMTTLGYKQSQGDHSLFIRHSNLGGVIALLVYVDDIIVTGNDEGEMENLKGNLLAEFDIKELGKLKYFLGIEVAHSKLGIFISQQKYVLDLLKETGKLGCKPIDTPIEYNHGLCDAPEDLTVDKGAYQRLVGKLIYLSHTRPDIAFAVSVVSRFMHNPKETHLKAVYRILQYLKGNPGRGILFKRGESMTIEAYTDADYAGSLVDRRSTSGYCTFLGGNLVTWRSKKQNVVARSSAESEFRSMAMGICELLWLKIILEDLKIKWEGPMRLYCDNKSAISIAHNPVQHDRTKHIEVDRHFIKEKLDSGLICTPFISTKDQLADVLTKGLPSHEFQQIIGKLGMEDIHSPA